MKMQDYQRGRSEGLQLAYRILQEGGTIKDLENEIRFRGYTKINTSIAMKEIEAASEQMRGFINEGHILMWLVVLHDEFDFGEKRLNRAMDRFQDIYGSIQDGYAGYMDYAELIQEKMGRKIKTGLLREDAHWKKDEDKQGGKYG